MRRLLLQWILVILLLVTWLTMSWAECVQTTLEGEFQAHSSNGPGFGTPITTGEDGAIYACLITPTLQTIIVRKHPQTGLWSSTLLEARTANDPHHTQCSLAIDPNGYLHVVYNMHNTPWQYKVSAQPNSIASMEFRGQFAGTDPSRGTPSARNCTGTCLTQWNTDEPGIAAIPGNQITYANFAYHQDGTLFLAFRECRYCSRSFFSREWSAGIVRYDHTRRVWERVGDGTRPWATDPARLPIAIRLYGDATGRMHALWLWCNHYTQAEGANPCWLNPNFFSYAYSDDKGETWRRREGTSLILPVSPGASEVVIGPEWYDDRGAIGYHSAFLRLMSGPCRNPIFTMQPHTDQPALGIRRGFVVGGTQGWTLPRWQSYSPMVTFQVHKGIWTALSSGMRIHRSRDAFQTQTRTELAVSGGPYSFAVDNRLLERTVPQVLRLYMDSSTTSSLRIMTVRFHPDTCPE